MVSHLESLSHTVTYFQPTASSGADQVNMANANDLVIISESIGSLNVSSGAEVRAALIRMCRPSQYFKRGAVGPAKHAGRISGAVQEMI